MATTNRFELRRMFERGTATLGKLFHEGNIRRMTIRDENGRTFLEMPLNVGIVSVVLAPVWVAVGFITAIATGYTVTLGRHTNIGLRPVRAPRLAKPRTTRKARRAGTETTATAH